MSRLLKHLREHPSIIPMVGLVCTASVGAIGFSVYSVYQKPDVHLRRSTNVPPHEMVDPTKPQKLYTIADGGYKVNPELEALRKELGPYKLK